MDADESLIVSNIQPESIAWDSGTYSLRSPASVSLESQEASLTLRTSEMGTSKARDIVTSSPAGNQTSDDLLMKCSQEVKEHYKESSNVLKIKLPPTTEEEIFSVDDLHVPVMLKRKKITADLPESKDVKAQELFQKSENNKKKILLYGPPGSGKTTEIKKWIHSWCYNKRDNPLHDFAAVFYIDAAEMKPGSSLGEEIKNQCLPAYSELSAECVEDMCRERKGKILVILDNHQRMKTDEDTNSIIKMVQLKDFPSMYLLVTTTSGGVCAFRKIYAHYDHVRVDGMDEKSVARYVNQLFKNRKDKTFKQKVHEYIKATGLVSVMASSPELLVILCQILKWHELPTEIETLKTTSAVTGRLMECLTRHSDYVDGRERELSFDCEPRKNESEGNEGELFSLPLSLKSDDGCEDSFTKEDIISRLAAVAFNCYLTGQYLENLQLREDDFDFIGEDMKSKVIDESMRLKLLFKLGEDEINPSSRQAAEGRVFKFLSPVIQQKLAAKHISKLLDGDDEDRKLFKTTLQKIGDTGEALSLRSLLLFACGESREVAFPIISHVVKLTQDCAKSVQPDPRKEDGVLREAHGHYQYLVEFILELNYEAQSHGELNDILRPIVTNMRILSPSVIMTRSLSYFLMYTSSANGPHIYPIEIEVYDVDKETKEKLPSLTHLRYIYNENAIVQVERGDPASQSKQTYFWNISRLSIRVEQMQTTHNEAPNVITTAVQAPNEDIPSASGNGMPSNDGLPLSIQESAEQEGGNLLERNSSRHYREIPEISHKEIKTPGDIPMAEGRFGEVFKVTYRGKEYAMKRLKNMDEDSCLSAQREIKMNARISHPNIVVLHAYAKYEIGNTGTYRFELLMDYINGYNLEQAIFQKKVKYLGKPKGQIELAWKMSDAIAHIHTKSCTHADIKPQNILIKVPENEPYLCDFGLGHAMTQSALTSGRRYCVQRWSPPECSSQGYHASFEGDIWSLACTILEVFTRRKVWNDYDHDWKLINRLKEDIVVPETLSDVEDPAIRDILGRCFTKEPSQRPEAKELVDTLKQVLDSV